MRAPSRRRITRLEAVPAATSARLAPIVGKYL
jgi:hypothetical protein